MRLVKLLVTGAALLLVCSGAVPSSPFGISPAYANSCTQKCRQQHNSCRIATKGSRKCDARLRRCLRRCVK
jgi:hypothetical protein